MSTEQTKPTTIDQYIAGFPQDIRDILEQIRATIKQAAPDAEEVISYGMPAFKQHGYLVFFAAAKKHIGMYGNTTAALELFKEELAAYVGSKGSLKFFYNQPIPYDLIRKLIHLRVQQDKDHAQAKANKK